MLGGWAEQVARAGVSVVPTPTDSTTPRPSALLGNYYTMYFALAAAARCGR